MKKAFAQISVNTSEEDESGLATSDRSLFGAIFGAIRRFFAGTPKTKALPEISFVAHPPELGCPDREKRISILVILNCAREFAAIDARKPADGRYFAPSREYFSKVVAELGGTQIERDELRAKLAVHTKEAS